MEHFFFAFSIFQSLKTFAFEIISYVSGISAVVKDHSAKHVRKVPRTEGDC